ncbi:LOW QUALITY PROTEIN: RNA-binding protein 14-like [Polistes fuscatus]|uniref:LOW QUALITY PROTEIN: RNA-binding protein 14-like n=1 Tax=Polistes fuscatus TaxID=30207 RepID=UPI001CA7FB03|nr:LOW QUALITY PROTEIN: RNA-binding protein 14-like [Polistes fuscatus]
MNEQENPFQNGLEITKWFKLNMLARILTKFAMILIMKLNAGVWTLHIWLVTYMTRLMSVSELGESVVLGRKSACISLSLDLSCPIVLNNRVPKIRSTPLRSRRHINTGPIVSFQQNTSSSPTIENQKMAFKLIVLSALLAIAHAGGPAAYDIATASADLSSVGYTQESTQKGYAGQNVVSSYSRAEDSAHSSVRVSNSHVTNDALTYAAPAAVIAKPAYTAATYAAPIVAKAALAPATYTTYAAHATPVLAKTAYAAAPAYSYAAHAVAPAYSYATHAAPVLAKTAYAAAPAYGYAAQATPVLASQLHAAAPVYSYSAQSGPVVTKTAYGTSAYGYASPLVAKTTYAAAPLVTKAAVAAPAVVTKTAYAAPAYAAPAYAATTYGYAAHATPVLAKATYSAPIAHVAATPVIAKAAHVQPAYGYAAEYAAPVVHATFTGLGTSYAW